VKKLAHPVSRLRSTINYCRRCTRQPRVDFTECHGLEASWTANKHEMQHTQVPSFFRYAAAHWERGMHRKCRVNRILGDFMWTMPTTSRLTFTFDDSSKVYSTHVSTCQERLHQCSDTIYAVDPKLRPRKGSAVSQATAFSGHPPITYFAVDTGARSRRAAAWKPKNFPPIPLSGLAPQPVTTPTSRTPRKILICSQSTSRHTVPTPRKKEKGCEIHEI
jgi:hypothetical protein